MTRTIPLGIYGQQSLNILEAIRLCKFKRGGRTDQVSWHGELCHFNIAPDGEITLTINQSHYNYCRSSWRCRPSVEDAKQFLISRMNKCLVLEERWLFEMRNNEYRIANSIYKYNGITRELLKQFNDESTLRKYLNIPENKCGFKLPSYQIDYTDKNGIDAHEITEIGFSELKLIIDLLIGRKRAGRNATAEMVNGIIGQKRNPLEIEMETARREEIRRLEEERDNEVSRIHSECRKTIDEFEARIKKDRDDKLALLMQAYSEKIASLKKLSIPH